MNESPSPISVHGSAQIDRRLIALNIGLGAVLLCVSLSGAQPAPRARGEYALVAGKAQSMTSHVVYILDTANRELAAIKWDRNRNQFEPLGYSNLAVDAQHFQPAR